MAYDVTKIFQGAPMVKLGELIEPKNERNSDLRYGIDLIEGVTSEGVFAPTKAVTNGINLKPYKAVRKGDFVYNPSRLNIGSLAYRDIDKMCIVSHLYVVFHIKESKSESVLPEYLLMFFRRDNFKRTIDIHNFGSQRAEFNIKQLSEIEIPLPGIEVQREYVAAYRSLQQLAEQNEALAAPLQDACTSLVIQCANKYDLIPLGKYIEPKDERNTNLEIRLSQGISNLKRFQDPKQVAANTASDKIVRHGQFAYNRATTRNGEKISIAYRDGEDCTVSSAYQVFEIKDENVLNPHFLLMWFTRPEFDRYARYKSEGSAHEFFDFSAMQRVRIPLPPIEVQRSIVALYNCAEEARVIAKEAREQLKILAPAMVQRAANTPVEV